MLQQTLLRLKISLINPIRPEKKLLVLDLDYTLFDMKSQAGSLLQLKRPYTDEFLTAVHPYYDIVIWSQTSWRWLEVKLTELGILTHPSYRILFVLDKTCMFNVTSRDSSSGSIRTHPVKALDLIWSQYKHWDRSNTIHVDDLARNFAMNPRCGLKIRPYKHALKNKSKDIELLGIARYLEAIAKNVTDFRTLNHNDWQKYLNENTKQVESTQRDYDQDTLSP